MAYDPSWIEHHRSIVTVVVQAELLGHGLFEDCRGCSDTWNVPWIDSLARDTDNDY